MGAGPGARVVGVSSEPSGGMHGISLVEPDTVVIRSLRNFHLSMIVSISEIYLIYLPLYFLFCAQDSRRGARQAVPKYRTYNCHRSWGETCGSRRDSVTQ